MAVILILTISALLQFSAAFLAFRIIKVTGKSYSWILISAALCLMGTRRLISLFNITLIHEAQIIEMNHVIIEAIGLLLSFLMLSGVAGIKPLLISRKLAEERHQQLLNNMMEGYQVISRDWRYIYVNNAVSGHGKKKKEELIGRTMMEAYPGIENTGLFAELKHCMEERIPHHMENEFTYPDGSMGWFDLNIQPVPDGVSVLSIDITEWKHAELALQSTKEYTETLIQTANTMVIGLDTEGKITIFNQAAEEITGYTHAEMENRNWFETIVPKDHYPEVWTEFKRLSQGGLPVRYENPILTKSGEERYIVWRNNVIREQDRPVGTISFGMDITERKQAEDELKKYREHLEELVRERTKELEETNARLQTEIAERMRMEEELERERNLMRTLIDSIPDEIYAKNIESRFIMANSNVLRSFGRTRFRDILGKTDFELLPQDKAMEAYSKEHSVLQKEGRMINYEINNTDADGNIRWYSITKVPLRDKDGSVTGLVGINKDITEFKQIEENLQKAKEAAETASRAKSVFLSNMSHEIRTPLNAILGFSELMLYDENLNKDQIEWIRTINRSGEHLLALINDILEISRIEAAHITLNPAGFDLHSLFHDIEAMFRIKTDAKNLAFLLECSDDVPEFVVTDEGKLRQIFINIVGNAVKFTEEGGIVIRARTEKKENGKMNLITEVEDTGPGIPEEEIDKVFQMFGQTEIGIKKGGTGLGLAISREYAAMMGGDILVKSKVGKGTCFLIIIDIGISDEAVKGKEPPEGRITGLKPGQKPYLVLVADDQKDNRKLLREMLISVGFRVEEAENGRDAVNMFKQWSPDIILMDMRMPVMDGYEAIRSIRTENNKIPIIAVTASAFYQDKQKALDAGANAYIRKPFKEHDLFKSIGSCLCVQYLYEADKKDI